MNKVKLTLVIVLLLAVIGIAAGVNIYQNRMIWNEEGVIGNTAGNLMNGGLFCEGDNIIYFSNPNHEGNLYSMDMNAENFELVYEDKVENLNYAGSYLVYSRKNYQKESVKGEMFVFNIRGLYTLQLENKQSKCLYNDVIGLVSLLGNDVFYQQYTEGKGLKLYQVRLNGKENKMMKDAPINPAALDEGYAYYAMEDQPGLFRMQMSTGQQQQLNVGNYYACMLAGGKIYALDLENGYTIVSMDMNGKNVETVVNETCSAFNVSEDGDYVYYQVDDGDNPRLERKNIHSGKTKLIAEGNYDRIHLIENWLFYARVSSEEFYYAKVNDLDNIQLFIPPQGKKQK